VYRYPICNNSAHAHKDPRENLASMQDTGMSYMYFRMYDQGMSWRGVQYAVVLDIGIVADRNPLAIPSKYRSRGDVTSGFQRYIADNHRVGMHK
jgi:hypothetical protein